MKLACLAERQLRAICSCHDFTVVLFTSPRSRTHWMARCSSTISQYICWSDAYRGLLMTIRFEIGSRPISHRVYCQCHNWMTPVCWSSSLFTWVAESICVLCMCSRPPGRCFTLNCIWAGFPKTRTTVIPFVIATFITTASRRLQQSPIAHRDREWAPGAISQSVTMTTVIGCSSPLPLQLLLLLLVGLMWTRRPRPLAFLAVWTEWGLVQSSTPTSPSTRWRRWTLPHWRAVLSRRVGAPMGFKTIDRRLRQRTSSEYNETHVTRDYFQWRLTGFTGPRMVLCARQRLTTCWWNINVRHHIYLITWNHRRSV